jgi:uncharacterized membrane protein YvbJ
VKDRHEIQKTTLVQWFIVIIFVVYIVLTVLLLNDFYSEKPFDLFGIENPSH